MWTGVVLVFIPALIMMFSDISMLPPAVRIVLLAIPYTHSSMASKAAFLGNYSTALTSIGYISLFTVVVLYVSARIFSTERIITARFTGESLRRLLRRGRE